MKKKFFIITFFLLISLFSFSQITWNFNTTNGLNGWSLTRLSVNSTTSNSVILMPNGQANPRMTLSGANINANLYKFAIIKLKVATNGSNFLRMNFGSNFKSTAITTGTTSIQTFAINMTDANWTGTINTIELAFRMNDGSDGGSSAVAANNAIELQEISFIENLYAGATELYVDFNNGNDNNNGTYNSPLKSVPYALNIAASNNISSVYVKSGTYNFTSTINITTIHTTPVTVSPEPNGFVKLIMDDYSNFRFFNGAKNIEIKGLEIDGKSNTVEHYTILSKYVWQPSTFPHSLSGGGIAFWVENCEDIKITNNVIHDFYQKAININNGRYIKISGNVIFNIGLTSLSGGHGIMRQQNSGSYLTPDDPNKYRWDIDGNLIFNVHQRIYSWVPAKGYLNMTLDEGKPILIDETPNHDVNMKAKISQNIVAFAKIDGIRIKPTNNLEVLNNTVYSKDHESDGITDTALGFNQATSGQPYLNFKCFNNAVDVYHTRQAFEIGESIVCTGSAAGNNFAGFGSIVPSTVATSANSNLFNNPLLGDFSLKIPNNNLGVSASKINELMNRADSFNVSVVDSQWEHDHLKNMQTLMDNMPGIEDGIANNESVFTDAGTYDLSDLEYTDGRKSLYFSINPTWQVANNVSNAVLNRGNGLDIHDGKYEIVVPEYYHLWFDNIKATYLRDTDNNGIGDTPYARIRHGASFLSQNKIFLDNSLHVVKINQSFDYTKTEAIGYNVTIDGDLLIQFNYTPIGYEIYDLITATNITSANAPNLFDKIKIEGYSGTYILEIIPGTTKVLRLTLTNLPQPITWRNQMWSNTTGPSSTNDALIDDNFNENSNIECHNLIINPSKQVKINSNKYLKVNGNLTNSGTIIFKSDALGTGRFDVFNGTLIGKGKVTVERYIPLGRRAFRFLSPSVSTTNFIKNNWQLNTHITGTTVGLNGFDTTLTGNPSMFAFNNHAITGSGWIPISNTNYTNLNAGQGYRVLIRGDRNVDINLPSQINMNAATTLSATGTLLYGSRTFNQNSSPAINNTTNTTTADFSLIGNPYISPINWNTISKTGLTSSYYAWDPNMGTPTQRGRYVAYNGITNDNPASQVNEFIQTGQAFFVKNSVSGVAGSLTINETNKVSTFTNVFRTENSNQQSKLTVSIFDNELLNNGELYPIDATLAIFNSSYLQVEDNFDARKLESVGENLAWKIGTNNYAINAFPIPENNNELLLTTKRLVSDKNYTFKFNITNFNSNLTAYLFDNYTNTQLNISTNAQNNYLFSTDTNPLSKDENRFKIVFTNTLSSEEYNMNSLYIYPNPSNSIDGFTLSETNDEFEISLFNMLGQKISIKKQQDNFYKTDTYLKTGIYFIEIKNNKKTKTIKWIIK